MTNSTRVAVIGAAGWAGSRHVHAFHDLGAHVVALVDPSPRTAELARQVDATVLDSADALRREDVDLVVVSLPTAAQPATVAALLQRGLRVLVEKPIGSSRANAAVLAGIDTIEDALMVGYTLHQHPIARQLAQWVSSADVVSVSVRSAARKLALDSWRTEPQEGGVTVVNGIHALEYVSSLFDGDATVHTAAASSKLFGTAASDYAAATISFADGPLFRLETYWNPWNHSAGLNGSDWSLEVDVVAQQGRRLWSNWTLHEWDRLGSETVRHFPETDLFLEQARAAIRFAAGERPLVGYRQALRATALADRVLAMSDGAR